jgi:hypothetical protein
MEVAGRNRDYDGQCNGMRLSSGVGGASLETKCGGV